MITASEITAVTRTALTKGYRFTAQDGSVIRAKATRPYAFAHVSEDVVCTGKPGLGAHVVFSSKATPPTGTFRTYRTIAITA